MPYPSKTTPQAILETAMVLLEQDGIDALSTRSLAKACGIKAPSLYRYFPDRQSLLSALAVLAAEQLYSQLQDQNLEPQAALKLAANQYLLFAREHPALYELLMQPQPSTGAQKELWNRFLALIGAVTNNRDDTANAVAFWAFLHGFATLERNGAFGQGGAGSAIEVGLTTWLKGLG